MKKFIIIGLLLLLCNIVEAKTTTLYCRSDTQTVNGLNAYKLLDTASSSSTYFEIEKDLGGYGVYDSDIIIRHADESETVIASAIASAQFTWDSNPDFEVIATNYSFPETSLVPTDAIKIVQRQTVTGTVVTEAFITVQLGWTKINASTWTFYRYVYFHAVTFPRPTYWRLYWGDSTYTTYIDGIQYEKPRGYAIIY